MIWVMRMARYIWAYWLSPFAYLMRGVVINEMTSPAWRTPVTTPDGTTTTSGNVSLLAMHAREVKLQSEVWRLFVHESRWYEEMTGNWLPWRSWH
jgi:hypothetical protein